MGSLPTAAPTSLPTAVPTFMPTSAPTASPTSMPTSAPTSAPTAAPTSMPTSAPTDAPTVAPTAGPTSAPTANPTSAPTVSPTSAPTVSPTSAPTDAPTFAPTSTPSFAPSACTQVSSFRINGKKKKNCAFVSRKEKRRIKLCNKERVRSNCPSSCGLCCADDDEFEFETEDDRVDKKDCAWIAKKFARRKGYCTDRGDSPNIRANCQLTCDNCPTLVSS